MSAFSSAAFDPNAFASTAFDFGAAVAAVAILLVSTCRDLNPALRIHALNTLLPCRAPVPAPTAKSLTPALTARVTE